MNYFVTAIGTDCGKTLVSAILCKALKADYWKPVQAGVPNDSDTVRALLGKSNSVVHPEKYIFKTPASPHAASALENISVRVQDFVLPKTQKDLIIEGAGGCLVPLNDDEFVIDLVQQFQAQVILVANLYLGSINHTLLAFEALQKRKLTIKGIIFNGHRNEQSERIILHHTKLRCLLHLLEEVHIDEVTVQKYALGLIKTWNE